jgi:ABC-type transport system involved in multi-copper enzyme maturation permease subunit
MKTIILKELLENIKSIQFIVLVCFSVVLFTANGIIYRSIYKQSVSSYNSSQQEKSTVSAYLVRNPSPLMFISEGGDRNRYKGYELSPKGYISGILPDKEDNNYLPEIPGIDWSFIVVVIFSLYAILMGYNSVSDEKVQGTLRLIISNPIGRFKLLTAKYLTIVFVTIVPLLIGMALSLIIYGFGNPDVFESNNLLRILSFIIISIAYVSLFVFLSLFFSTCIKTSSLSLMILLVVWVLFVIIIPNLSDVFASKIFIVKSEYKISLEFKNTYLKQLENNVQHLKTRIKANEFTSEDEIKNEFDKTFQNIQDKIIKYYRSYDLAMRQREKLSGLLSRSSPSSLFQYAGECLAGTGLKEEEKFFQDVENYSSIYDAYIIKKFGKVVSSSVWNFTESAIFNGKEIFLRSPFPEEYSGDKSDFPMFKESRKSLAGSLKSAFADLTGLLLWNLVLAIGAFLAFNRADVR